MKSNKTRVNQEFAKHSSLIGKVKDDNGFIPFADDNELVKNLIYYISELHQIGTDSHGYIRLDLKEFCKEFGYASQNYQKSIDKESTGKIRIVDTDEFHTISNTFEKTLTNIASQNIPIPVFNGRGNNAIQFVPVIHELEIGLSGTGYKDKRAYFLKLHDDYKRKFINYFNTTSSEIYKRLKKNHKRTKGLQDLYLKLEVEKSKQIYKDGYFKKLTILPNFDELCSIAQIKNTYENKDKKKALKLKLQKIKKEAEFYNDELVKKDRPLSDFLFEFDFIHKPNTNFPYQPKITFYFSDDVIKQKEIEQRRSAEIFEKQYKIKLSEEYNNLTLMTPLDEWLSKDRMSSDLKRIIYIKEFETTYNKQPSEKYLRERFG